ncbi:MAG: hypothetical protein CR977_00145 [Gammaproteobacteria bacterium]|nr:MAG: hypothetical protein CR977_00145 [Gammaproteobacteria bacterium]
MHKKAPLPFIGQKRNFINHFISVVNQVITTDGDGWTIIDAFGGSGLLSHVSKRCKPGATVIYNDFDDYHVRLRHINDTNRLRQKLAVALANSPRQKQLSVTVRASVLDCIAGFDGYLDWAAIGSWLLFSGKYATSLPELRAKTLYNTIRRTDYALADGYLNGLTRVKRDFALLLSEHQHNPKALFILDPPYVCTTQGMYANKDYFGMVEFLRLMRLVRPPFIFFSSTRSELVDYLDFVVENNLEGSDRLAGYQRISIDAKVNKTAKYEDNLIYKF